MARIPSRLNHGYYPTPTRVVDMVASYLHPTEKMVWLDPSAGEGYALKGLARRVGNKPLLHGVEIFHPRAATAREQLDEVVEEDVNSVVFARHGYSLLWFNPEYDENRLDQQEGKRLSEVIFKHIMIHPNSVLMPGGIFVGILHYNELLHLTEYLWRYFQGPEDDGEKRSYPLIFQFPDPEFEEFGQYVILGRRRKRALAAVPEEVKKSVLDGVENETYPRLTYSDHPLFKVLPVPEAQQAHMRTKTYQPKHGAQVVLRHGFASRPAYTTRYWREPDPPLHPILPLQDSHLALLLASGALNTGKVFDCTPEGGLKYVLRGRTTRKTETISQEKDEMGRILKYTTRETYVTELLIIDQDGNPQRLTVTESAKRQDEEDQKLFVPVDPKDLSPIQREEGPYNGMNNQYV